MFWAGLSISAAAFMIGQATRMPSIQRLISPASANATIGEQKLIKTGILEPKDTGFIEIEDLFRKKIAPKNSVEAMREFKVESFTCNPDMFVMPVVGSEDRPGIIQIGVNLQNKQTLDWNEEKLAKSISSMKEKSILLFSTSAFFLGAIITISSRWLKQTSESAHQKKLREQTDLENGSRP